MSDATDAERKLVGTCIAWECEQPVHPPAVFCPTHAQPANPGVIEPHLEARARQAGEAEMRRIREEQPLVLDIGEIPAPTQSHTYGPDQAHVPLAEYMRHLRQPETERLVDPQRAEAVERARVTLQVHRALIDLACTHDPRHVRDSARAFADYLDRLDAGTR